MESIRPDLVLAARRRDAAFDGIPPHTATL